VDYVDNFITEPYWTQKLEAQGSVFLPAAGIRDINNVGLEGRYGAYWTSSYYDESNAYLFFFSNSFLNPTQVSLKCGGRSVRLVRAK
jgi:hypothetical protein